MQGGRNAAAMVAGLGLAVGLLAGAGPAAAQSTTLEQARRNYPPMIIGTGTRAVDGSGPYPLACPAAGSRVEQRGGPATEYLGASPANPELCRMRVAGEMMEAWFAIWVTAWPGAAEAYPAMKRAMQGPTGTVAGFDTYIGPTAVWHELIRNEGVEDITLLDKTYRAMKLSHYREGFNGNIYRSVATVWKDIGTGMLIYATYQHIAGRPELDAPLLPTAIVPAP